MKECNRCGECCKVLAMPVNEQSRSFVEYARIRGLKIDNGWLIVPCQCQYLRDDNQCMIYENRPLLCKIFTGQKRTGKIQFYVPKKCVHRSDKNDN